MASIPALSPSWTPTTLQNQSKKRAFFTLFKTLWQKKTNYHLKVHKQGHMSNYNTQNEWVWLKIKIKYINGRTRTFEGSICRHWRLLMFMGNPINSSNGTSCINNNKQGNYWKLRMSFIRTTTGQLRKKVEANRKLSPWSINWLMKVFQKKKRNQLIQSLQS